MNTHHALREVAENVTTVATEWFLSHHTDRQILNGCLQKCDESADFVNDHNYLWWAAIGKVVQPRVIAEMGTRYGYSLWSLAYHSFHPLSEITLHVFDAEVDGVKTLDTFERTFRDYGFKDIRIVRENTQTLDTLGLNHTANLVVVDAWHTFDGVKKECELALGAVKPGGYILVDDTKSNPDGSPNCVRDGCEAFCRDHDLPYAYLPSYRGIHLIRVPETPDGR